MPTFYWVPYFEGKLLNYYQYFALVGSSVVALIALVCYLTYLQLKNCNRPKHQHDRGVGGSGKWEKFFYKATFIFLSLVPLICSATDAINTVFGMLGMMAILSYMVLTQGKVDLRNVVAQNEHEPLVGRTALHRRRTVKKQLLIVAIVSIVIPLFCHRTCLCFYNNEIGWYNHPLGFGVNTMVTRFFQL